jgi:transposase InsO family protein
MAIATRKTDNLIHHSDQGIQYTCKDYIKILKDNGIRISMSVKGNPYDNAFAESFFKTLKQEEVYLWEYKIFSDVVERIPYFIEDVYNKKRLHSSLGYRPPDEYESLFSENDSQECIMAKTISV